MYISFQNICVIHERRKTAKSWTCCREHCYKKYLFKISYDQKQSLTQKMISQRNFSRLLLFHLCSSYHSHCTRVMFYLLYGRFEQRYNTYARCYKKTDCNKQSKNEINTKNQSRKLNGNPNHCYWRQQQWR